MKCRESEKCIVPDGQSARLEGWRNFEVLYTLIPPRASSGWTSGSDTSPGSSGSADAQPAALWEQKSTKKDN